MENETIISKLKEIVSDIELDNITDAKATLTQLIFDIEDG